MPFLSDLRVALRTLLRAPGFFAMSAGVLALGIAAVSVMFGFLRATMAPPPLDRIDRVYAIPVLDRRNRDPEQLARLHDIEDWNREQKSFEGGVAGFQENLASFWRLGSSPERLNVARVTGPFFQALRVNPLVGRVGTREDNLPGATPVVILSERLWRSSFGADPSVIGESVHVNGESHTVVGIAPASLDLPVGCLLWVPDRTDTSRDPQFLRGVSPLPRMLAPAMRPFGRLRDGVTPEEARAELRVLQSRRVTRYPEVAGERPDVRPLPLVWMGSEYQRLFRVLLGSVALVLLLACVNVAGLLLVRGAARTHEAAVRRALGAGRLRLSGQMLAEAVIIGLAAALLAVTVAEAAMEVLRRVIPALLPTTPSWWRVGLDLPTLLFTLGVAVLAALGAGLHPAIRASRVSVDPLLRDGQRDTGLHSARLIQSLVVVEIALSAALLTASGLVIRSGAKLGHGDVGVPTAGFLVARFEFSPRSSFGTQRAFNIGLMSRLRAIPGVEGTTLTTAPPGITPTWHPVYQLPDRGGARPEELPSSAVIQVGPGYFETFRIPVRGRTFLETDRDPRSSIVVVSESFARAAWPGVNPIGKRFQIAPQETWVPPVTVVGVAKDVRYDERLRTLGTNPPVIYVPAYQWPAPVLYIVLRAPADPLAAAESVRLAVNQLDYEIPIFSARTLDEERQLNAAKLILIGRMFAVFGVVALALAAAGVYGVLAYSVAQGSREIAIRRALGAPGWRLVATVVARSGWQLVLGLALGVALAPAMGALIGSVMGQPEPALRVYLGVGAILSATVLVAVAVPLQRALGVQPSAALRHT